MNTEAEFKLQRPRVGRRTWKPAHVIDGKQMALFVGASDPPNQGLLFGEITEEAKQESAGACPRP